MCVWRMLDKREGGYQSECVCVSKRKKEGKVGGKRDDDGRNWWRRERSRWWNVGTNIGERSWMMEGGSEVVVENMFVNKQKSFFEGKEGRVSWYAYLRIGQWLLLDRARIGKGVETGSLDVGRW